MIKKYCISSRKTLPVVSCGNNACDWFVHHDDYCNCFWVVANYMHRLPGMGGFSLEEIAKMENCSTEQIVEIFENAVKVIRNKHRKLLISL